MKKFFKGFGKKSGKGPPPEGSPKVGRSPAASTASFSMVGYDVREKDLGKLHKAAWSGDLMKVKQLAKKDHSPLDKENRTPLHLACVRGHADIVQELLEWKAKANIGDNECKTPLLKAVECHQEDCVALLLDNRVEVDASDSEGNTSLHYAVHDGHRGLITQLIQAGAKLNAKNKSGLSPLHVAIHEKRDAVAQGLLEEGADVNSTDNNRRSPLMYSCQEGSTNLVRLLLRYNADTTLKDLKDWTAEDCAIIQGHHGCSQLITDHNIRNRIHSNASTPRSGASLPISATTTPRGDSTFGVPAGDVGHEDDSGEESLSKDLSPGKDVMSDWGDDTDISVADDKKLKEEDVQWDTNEGQKVSLSKYVGTLPGSDSESMQSPTKVPSNGELGAEYHDEASPQKQAAKRMSSKSFKSDTSIEDDSWSMSESDASPRPKRRVSFKRDEDLSEIKHISEESDSDDKRSIQSQEKQAVGQFNGQQYGYTPSGVSAGIPMPKPLTPEQHRAEQDKPSAIMEDLGLGDADDISDPSISEFSEMENKPVQKPKSPVVDGESDWDSTTADQNTPRPGILKKGKQSSLDEQEELKEEEKLNMSSSQHIAEIKVVPDTSHVKQVSHDEASEWDSDVEDVLTPAHSEGDKHSVQSFETDDYSIRQDGDWEDEASEISGTIDLKPVRSLESLETDLHMIVEDHSSISDLELPKESQQVFGNAKEQDKKVHQESDWDSTTEAPTPRNRVVDMYGRIVVEDESSDIDDVDMVDEGNMKQPSHQQQFEEHVTSFQITKETSHKVESVKDDLKPPDTKPPPPPQDNNTDGEDSSGWDSDTDILPSEKNNIPVESSKDHHDTPMQKMEVPVTPRSESMEEESISEWELERKLEKEKKLKAEVIKEETAKVEMSSSQTDQNKQETNKLQMQPEIDESDDEFDDDLENMEVHQTKNTFLTQQKETHSPRYSEQKETVVSAQTSSIPPSSSVPADIITPNTAPTLNTSAAAAAASTASLSKPGTSYIQPEQTGEVFVAHSEKIGVDSKLRMSAESDGNSLDDEDSFAENFNQYIPAGENRTDILAKLPPHTTVYTTVGVGIQDDDGLSYTSTETDFDGPPLGVSHHRQNQPTVLTKELLLNIHDAGDMLKLQEFMRDNQRQFDIQRSQNLDLQSKYTMLQRDNDDIQRKIRSISSEKSRLEQTKLDLEAKIRNLEYNFNEESENRKNAELLLTKTKEQLARKEEQYSNEMESKQKTEHSMRNTQVELRKSNAQVKDLQEEREELQRQLQHEKNARSTLLQEKEDQKKLHEHLVKQNSKTIDEKESETNEVLTQLDSASQGQRDISENYDKVKAELYAVQMELQRQRTRTKDETTFLSSENEELQSKTDELKNELKISQEALDTSTIQYNMQISKLNKDISDLTSALDKERALKEKSETELGSITVRLQSTVSEMERAEKARNDSERSLQREKEDWLKKLEDKEHEMSALRESKQDLMQQLTLKESEKNSVENELQVTSSTLLERTNQLQQVERDFDVYRNAHEKFDDNYRVEKEYNTVLQDKVMSIHEKLTEEQKKNLTLQHQLETVQKALQNHGPDAQEKFLAILDTLKSDHERTIAALEAKNESLNETISRLREDLKSGSSRRNSLDHDMRRINSEIVDLTKKLSLSEGALEVAKKSNEQLEQDRVHLKLEIEALKGRHQASQEKCLELQKRIAELVERLEKAEQSSLHSSQQLIHATSNMESMARAKPSYYPNEANESVQKTQVDNVRLETELKHERQRCEMLQKDLLDSQKVRNSLEALCANLKTTNATLEDKVGFNESEQLSDDDEEAITRTVLAKEAEENKDLWEKEVITKSKLGLRLVQLEKERRSSAAKLEEERRKVFTSMEMKKSSETRLEMEIEKNNQLQKEINSLKGYLKSAKKKLKNAEVNELQFNTNPTSFDLERMQLDDEIISVKRQLEDVNNKLHTTLDEKEHLFCKNRELQYELNSQKYLEKTVKSLEKNKRKLEDEYSMFKSQVENGFVDKTDVDQMRKELEAYYRLELNRKLDEVNQYLAEQARMRDHLEQSRLDSEARLKSERKRLEEEVNSLKLKYEQTEAQKETKDLESKRYRDLYETEMKWRLKLNDQLDKSTDKALTYKARLLSDKRDRSKQFGSLGNLSLSNIRNGHPIDISINNLEEPLSNKLRAELDRSISKHLEAAPHDILKPVVRDADNLNSSLYSANSDYLELLKRKFCV